MGVRKPGAGPFLMPWVRCWRGRQKHSRALRCSLTPRNLSALGRMEHWLLVMAVGRGVSGAPIQLSYTHPRALCVFLALPSPAGRLGLGLDCSLGVGGAVSQPMAGGRASLGVGDRCALLDPLRWHHQAVPGCPGPGRFSFCGREGKDLVSPGVSVGESQQGWH